MPFEDLTPLQAGDTAPDFTLPSALGPEITLEQLPDALAGRLNDPRPAKYSVRTQTESDPVQLMGEGGGARV